MQIISSPDEVNNTIHQHDQYNIDFDNTYQKYSRVTRKLVDTIHLGVLPGVFGDEMGVNISPSQLHEVSLHTQGQCITTSVIDYSNVASYHHNIGMEIYNHKIQLLEHILGTMQGIGIEGFNIELEVSKLRKLFLEKSYWGSFPFDIDNLIEKILCKSEIIETNKIQYTFDKEYKLEFGNDSYMVLIPSEDDSLVLDLRISYSTPGIGNQRIRFDIGDIDTFTDLVVPARTGCHNEKERKIYREYFSTPGSQDIISNIPKLRNFLPTQISPDSYVVHDETGIYNPNRDYYMNGTYMEIIFHEILDKLGALAISPLGDKQLCGTILYNRVSHDNDLSMLGAMHNGDIQLSQI